MDKLVVMGIDLYNGKITNFSKEEANEAFRQAMLEITNGETNIAKLDPMQKHNLFGLVTKTLDKLVPEILGTQFDRFVETKTAGWGEKLAFEVADQSLFQVATIAYGTNDIRRQRLDNGILMLDTKLRSVKIYDELRRFLANKIDWAGMVNRVAQSFALQIKVDIYNAIYNSFNTLGANYKENGTFDAVKFNTLVQRVEGISNGLNAMAFGTKLALAKVVPTAGFVSTNVMDEIQKQGYLGQFQGTPCVELGQAMIPGTENFAIANDFILITPSGADKIVKLGFEGEALIRESVVGEGAGQQLEYLFEKAYGVSVLVAGAYAMYKLS